MEYIKTIEKQAKKFIDKQDKFQRERIYRAIKDLPNGDIKKLQSSGEYYRLRVGDYRIIFHWTVNKIVINVTHADNRGDVYKKGRLKSTL